MIVDILAEVGHPLGSGGRTTCPIHGGDNPTAFKYNDLGYCCFVCGAKGGERHLRDKLGLAPVIRPREPLRYTLPLPIPEGLEGYADLSPELAYHQRPSVRLAAAACAWRNDLYTMATGWHRRAREMLDRPLPPGLDPEEAFAMMALARVVLAAAHRAFRDLDASDTDCCDETGT